MPVTVGYIVDALLALGGEAHYTDITKHVLQTAPPPFPEDPSASVRARLQERCSEYKAYLGQADLFESDIGSGIWRFRQRSLESANRITALRDNHEDYVAQEGGRVLNEHYARERDATLIAKFKASLSDPRCEACGMSFAEVYGEIGIGYIEAHHKTPVAEHSDGTKTTLADLACLCANCHRIIHRNYPMTVEALSETLAAPGGFADYMGATFQTRATWKVAVKGAIMRLVASRQSREFTRHDIIEAELPRIVEEVGSNGETPEQTLSRVLQELRQEGVIEFLDSNGRYSLK